MTKKDYMKISNFIQSVRETSSWRVELNEKYNVVPGTVVYDIIQNLKEKAPIYAHEHFYGSIYWNQNEKAQFKRLISFGMLYGLCEYLNDNIPFKTGKKRHDINKLEEVIDKYKKDGLASLLSMRFIEYYPYKYPYGDPYLILQENWLENLFNRKTGRKYMHKQFWLPDSAYMGYVIPSKEEDINFVKEHKDTLVKYSVPEILDLYLTWVSNLYSEYYKYTR